AVRGPFTAALPVGWVGASPAIAAAGVWRTLAPTRTWYRCASFASLKVNRDRGRTEYITSGGSMCFGGHTMATDQPSAARLNSRLQPSATHGSQPAMK